jgi:hypothetical protein
MQSSTITITAVFALITIGLAVGYPSVLTNSAIYDDNEFPEVRFIAKSFEYRNTSSIHLI